MVIQGTDKKYKSYLKQHQARWEFGNDILYNMCRDYPLHEKEDVIAGKIWLIGRSYAAAIERRKNAVETDDFYYDVVVPKMLKIGKELDVYIGKLKESQAPIIELERPEQNIKPYQMIRF